MATRNVNAEMVALIENNSMRDFVIWRLTLEEIRDSCPHVTGHVACPPCMAANALKEKRDG